MGHGYIDAKHAERINEFYRNHFNPYLNFHRPCGVRKTKTDKNGKQKIVYKWYATPWEILRQLPDVTRRLKDDVTLKSGCLSIETPSESDRCLHRGGSV